MERRKINASQFYTELHVATDDKGVTLSVALTSVNKAVCFFILVNYFPKKGLSVNLLIIGSST